MRKFSILMSVLALGLAGWGGYLALKPSPVSAVLVVQDMDRDVGEVAVGEYPLTFRITNPSDRPGRIIGLNEG